jgi:MFS family permease
MTFAQDTGFVSFQTLGLFCLFIISLVGLIQTEKHVSQPLIELSIFKNRVLRTNLITGFLTFIASSGIVFLIPFYLQNVLRYDPELAGILMAVFPVMLGIAGPISGWLSDRFGFHLLTVTGLLVLSLGYFGLTQLSVSTSSWEFALIYLPIGIGMGLFQSPNNSSVLGSASSERLGVVSSLLAITRTLGQTCGTAVIGSLWAILVMGQSSASGSGLNNVTLAPIQNQVTGLHTVSIILGILLFAGTILSVIVWVRESRKDNRKPSLIMEK